MKKLIQVKQKDLSSLRKEQWLKQDKKCPILNQEISFEDSVMDHLHISKTEIKDGKIGENGKALLRGVLHKQVNSWEGKISNSFIRYGLHKFGINISDALRKLADFLENPLIEQKYIHPSEKEKPEYLKKSIFNKVKKHYFDIYPKRKKFKYKFRKKMRITKDWQEMIKLVNELEV